MNRLQMNQKSLRDMIGEEVVLEGIAENGKGGALIVLPQNEVIYIRHLGSWDDVIRGMRISVKGVVRYEKYIPDPEVSSDGAISQGAIGSQYVLDDAQWDT
ncbi:MAG: hypothetical protein ACFFED_14855 [Candidatus Thorarchaeota archaeon]